jgi:hypothetical protein
MSRSVVLPTPLGPMIATGSPARTVRLKDSNSARPPKPLERSRTRSTSSPERRRAGELEAHLLFADGLFHPLHLLQPLFTALGGLMDFSRL